MSSTSGLVDRTNVGIFWRFTNVTGDVVRKFMNISAWVDDGGVFPWRACFFCRCSPGRRVKHEKREELLVFLN